VLESRQGRSPGGVAKGLQMVPSAVRGCFLITVGAASPLIFGPCNLIRIRSKWCGGQFLKHTKGSGRQWCTVTWHAHCSHSPSSYS